MIDQAYGGMGMAPHAAKLLLPSAIFLPDSDLGPVDRGGDQLVEGLCGWQLHDKRGQINVSQKISVRGRDYLQALEELQHLFIRNHWSDGLPLCPATEQRVQWILSGTPLEPDLPLGKIQPRGGLATPRSLAVVLAMAGGRPEHLPVLIAAVEAMLSPRFHHERMNTTTCSVYPVVVVNGPITQQIMLGSGYGCLGPDPCHPAGAVLGRALRLALMNLGGALPGKTTMSIFGGPARYTGLVFAEDEAGLPQGWPSFGQERGRPAGANVVSLYAVSSNTNVPGGETGSDTAARASLNRAAGCIGIPNGNYWFTPYNPEGSAGLLLMARGTAQGLARLGWSKEQVKEYLWQNSMVPATKLGPRFDAWWFPEESVMRDPMPVCLEPRGIEIVIAGGEQSGHMMWLQAGCCPECVTSAEVRLPVRWDELVRRAAQDLTIPEPAGPACEILFQP